MYLEREDEHQSHTMSNEEVKEATEALKGMLGIGKPVATLKTSKNKHDGTKKKNNEGKKQNEGSNKNNNNNNAGKGRKKKEKKSPKENFAWSAFQSTPDASALPIPAFAPGLSTNPQGSAPVAENGDKLPALLTGVGGQESNNNNNSEEIANATRAEDLEAQVIAEAEKAAAEARDRKRREETANGGSNNNDNNPAAIDSPRAARTDDTEVSKSGINLAELAASPTSRPHDSLTPPGSEMHLPPSLNAMPGPTSFMPPNQFTNSSHPPAQFLHAPTMAGYVTIPVRVPPVLMPGRRMLVPSPAGYPVQIVVPEGIPPGMVIPVHVPAASMMQTSYGYPPANPAMQYPMHPSSPHHPQQGH